MHVHTFVLTYIHIWRHTSRNTHVHSKLHRPNNYIHISIYIMHTNTCAYKIYRYIIAHRLRYIIHYKSEPTGFGLSDIFTLAFPSSFLGHSPQPYAAHRLLPMPQIWPSQPDQHHIDGWRGGGRWPTVGPADHGGTGAQVSGLWSSILFDPHWAAIDWLLQVRWRKLRHFRRRRGWGWNWCKGDQSWGGETEGGGGGGKLGWNN